MKKFDIESIAAKLTPDLDSDLYVRRRDPRVSLLDYELTLEDVRSASEGLAYRCTNPHPFISQFFDKR